MISIIVPIYNTEAYVGACVDSLLTQNTGEPLQIILVDDASTDNSAAIAESYASRHAEDTKRQVVLLRQAHAGQSVARNLGLQHAKGEYIAFVDADDRLAPDWCERHLKAIGNADYVQSGYRRTLDKDEKGWWVGRRHLPKNRYQFTSPCMRLYRREILDGLHFEKGIIYEDILFSTDLWLKGAQCKMIRYAGYLYTRNPQSTTAKRHLKAQHHVLQALRDRRKGQPWHKRQIINYTLFRLTPYFVFK